MVPQPDFIHSVQAYYERNPRKVSSLLTSNYGLREILPDLSRTFLGDLSNKQVLDLGCGHGRPAALLPDSETGRYIGVDLVHSNLAGKTDVGVRSYRVLSDAHCLGLKENSVDVILIFDLLEHAYDEKTILREAYRVLKSGGKLLVSTTNYMNLLGLKKWWYETFGTWKRHTWSAFQDDEPQVRQLPLTLTGLCKSLQSTHFCVEYSIGFDPISGLFPFFYQDGQMLRGFHTLERWVFQLNHILYKKKIPFLKYLCLCIFVGASKSEPLERANLL